MNTIPLSYEDRPKTEMGKLLKIARLALLASCFLSIVLHWSVSVHMALLVSFLAAPDVIALARKITDSKRAE